MQNDTLFIWILLGAGSLFMTILCVTFSRLLNIILAPRKGGKMSRVVVVDRSEAISNVGPVQEKN